MSEYVISWFDAAVTFVVEDSRIARIYAIRNPHKLARLEKVAGAAALTALDCVPDVLLPACGGR